MAVIDEPPRFKRGTPRWLLTYADMMTLLLCVFVMLVSFANTDITKFREVRRSMKDAFGVHEEVPGMGKEGGTALLIRRGSAASNEAEKQRLVNLLKTMVKEEGVEKNTLLVVARNGVRLEITELEGHAMFERGGTRLTPESQRLLRKMIPTMKETIYKITVEGHSDNIPLSSPKFPSNWELSSARAGRVVRFLIQEGELDSRRFTAVGYADTKPLVENTTPGNRDKNRRVSILYEVF